MDVDKNLHSQEGNSGLEKGRCRVLESDSPAASLASRSPERSSKKAKISGRKKPDSRIESSGNERNTRRPLSGLLDVAPRVLEILQRKNIKNLLDLWGTTTMELHSMGLSQPESADLLRKAAQISCQNLLSQTGLSRLSAKSTLSFGCPVLDAFFRKGCPTDQLVEFSGEAGTGKTQVCLQLALTVQMPVEKGGLDGGFPSRRLNQMTESGAHPEASMDRIFVEQLNTFETLVAFLSGKIHELFRLKPIRLIIIDSVASVFRYEDTELISPKLRSERIQSLGLILKYLQERYSAAVVCANQVTDVVKEPETLTQYSRSNTVIPALGITWSNFVTTRVMLAKTYEIQSCDRGTTGVRRRMRVLFSPGLPVSDIEFEVWKGGVRGKEDKVTSLEASQPV